jgi:hypothetical protein
MNNSIKVINFSRIIVNGTRKRSLQAYLCDIECKNFPIEILVCQNDECGKTFCKTCFLSSFGNDIKCTESTCGHSLKEDSTLKYLNELIKCINEDKGCTERKSYSGILEHENICCFREYFCEHCRKIILLKEKDDHLLICEEVFEVCSFCNLQVKRKDCTTHIDKECSERLINCSLCGSNLKANLISQHNLECICTEVKCEFCDELMLRKDTDKHLCVLKSNQKIIVSIEKIRSSLSKQEEKTEEIHKKCEKFELLLSGLEEKFEKIENKVTSIINKVNEFDGKIESMREEIDNNHKISIKINEEQKNMNSLISLIFEELKKSGEKLIDAGKILDEVKKCTICKSRKKENFCGSCKVKFCEYCTNRCALCTSYVCSKCSFKLENCQENCSNHLCSECNEGLRSSSTSNQLFYYGMICNRRKCIHCNKMKTCVVCNINCCESCFSYCITCAQDKICEACFINPKMIVPSGGSFNNVNCGHNELKDIYFGLFNGKVSRYNYKKQSVIGETRITTGAITSLASMNGKLAFTSSSGDMKILNNLTSNVSKDYFLDKRINDEHLQLLKINETKLALMHQFKHKKIEIININNQPCCEKPYISNNNSSLLSFNKFKDDFILIGRDDNQISLWNPNKGQEFSFNTGHGILGKDRTGVFNVMKLQNSKSNDNFLTTGGDMMIKVWNLSDDKFVKNIFTENVNIYAGWVMKVKELLDGRIVFCANDQKVKIFDLSKKEVTAELPIGKTYDYLVINSNLFITVSEDCIVRTVDLRKNSVISEFQLDNPAYRIMSPINCI